MNFDIDPRELNLQGADGMQLVRLLRRLIAEEGGGGGDEPVPSDVSDFFYCTYGVTTYSEIHNALTANKIPVCPVDGYYYYLVNNAQSRYTFACYNNVNHSIVCVRCASSGWDTVTFLPQEKLTWDYAPREGSTNPVTSGGVFTAIKNGGVNPEDIQEAVDEWLEEHSSSIGGLSYEAKQALMNCFENVAWINNDGQDYYDALYAALFGTTPVTPTVESISAVFNQGSAVIYDDATLDSLRQYLTVTAYYSDSTSQVITNYTLAGTLTAGQSVITASYQGNFATFTVDVTARATLISISAVFTQSGTVYTNDTLDTLKQYLTVTATYADSTTAVVTDYTLSGTLGEGTRTITVSYGGKSDTFNVVCTVNGWLYHFEQTLESSGSEDFLFSGDAQYTQGVNANEYAYWHNVGTEGTSSTDPGAIIATGINPVPDFSSDFTLAYWFKDITANRVTPVSAYNVYSSASSSYSTTGFGAGTIDAQGWSVAQTALTKKQRGIRIRVATSGGIDLLLSDTGNANGRIYSLTYPSTFDTTVWHHYALTRQNNVMYFFVDGVQIMHATVSASVKFGTKIALGSYFDIESSSGALMQTGYGSCFDDFYVSDFCKWSEAFDPSAIVY